MDSSGMGDITDKVRLGGSVPLPAAQRTAMEALYLQICAWLQVPKGSVLTFTRYLDKTTVRIERVPPAEPVELNPIEKRPVGRPRKT